MILAEGLSKRFGAVTAVNGLSFSVEVGETFAVIGPNGAGKTTTLKMLLGLVRPDSGRVGIGPGRLPPADPRARHELGYVPQGVEFPPGRSVAEMLAFFADLRGLPAAAVTRALERVGLAGHAGRRASELSGGYTQRLSLAQALLGDPALLVLDEPTASLDPEATWEFRSLVETLRREGHTVLLCSHLLAEVERVADRVLILVDGRAAALERMDDLRARQMQATRLGLEVPGAAARAAEVLARDGIACEVTGEHSLRAQVSDGGGPAALEALRAAGVPVRTFEVVRPTLEEIFLGVVRGERP
jgi:ABC-type multidrug transport system ATPase subunit